MERVFSININEHILKVKICKNEFIQLHFVSLFYMKKNPPLIFSSVSDLGNLPKRCLDPS